MSEMTATAVRSLERFVPSASVMMYNYNGAESMTLAQAIMAMSFRRSVQLEAESVIVMNMMNANTSRLTKLSEYAEDVVPLGQDQTVSAATWNPIRAYLIDSCAVAASSLPDEGVLDTYSKQLLAYSAIETKLKEYNSTSESLGIELQTNVSHRDSFYTMSVNMTTHLAKSGMSSAAALRGK